MIADILWRRLDVPGHEVARLNEDDHRIEGTALFLHEEQVCKLDYHLICDDSWQTLTCTVLGWVGQAVVNATITVRDNTWMINGKQVETVSDCLDIDLNFSPVTNTLPIKRLNLAIGEKQTLKAAWLRFPGFYLEPLEQSYERLSDFAYRYESAGGSFVADVEVNHAGLVTRYENLWIAEN